MTALLVLRTLSAVKILACQRLPFTVIMLRVSIYLFCKELTLVLENIMWTMLVSWKYDMAARFLVFLGYLLFFCLSFWVLHGTMGGLTLPIRSRGLTPCSWALSGVLCASGSIFIVWWGNDRGHTFLSLIGEFKHRLGRTEIRLWSPNLYEGFSCSSFLRCLLNSYLFKEFSFCSLEGEHPKKGEVLWLTGYSWKNR